MDVGDLHVVFAINTHCFLFVFGSSLHADDLSAGGCEAGFGLDLLRVWTEGIGIPVGSALLESLSLDGSTKGGGELVEARWVRRKIYGGEEDR